MPDEREEDEAPAAPTRPQHVRRRNLRILSLEPGGFAQQSQPQRAAPQAPASPDDNRSAIDHKIAQAQEQVTAWRNELATLPKEGSVDAKITEAREQVTAWRDELATLQKEAFPPAAKEVTEPKIRDNTSGGDGGSPPPRADANRAAVPLTPNEQQTVERARETGVAASTPSADPRFARAPMTPAEMMALHQAPHADPANQLLGQMQEARLIDGRLPSIAPSAHKSPPLIDTYMSHNEQITLGLRPTPQQLAHLQSAPTPDVEKARTMNFLAERRTQNAAWFDRSRRWGPELDRQARATSQTHPEERIGSPQGVHAWRSELSELQKLAYRNAGQELSNATKFARDQPLSPDPRFAAAPMSPDEMQALHRAATPEAVRQVLGQMQEARLKDGRLPQTSHPHPEKAEINQALTLKEQISLGLRPTAQELAYLQAGAMQGQEHARTMAFIIERQAHNDYWNQRAREWSPQAQRDARREITNPSRTQKERNERDQSLREARLERDRADLAGRGHDRGGGRDR